MNEKSIESVLIIVAHPDDETLWAGGTILIHPEWRCFVISLCRGSDKDRAFRFHNALKVLNAQGVIADLNDGPTQDPLNVSELDKTILELLPTQSFDLMITHNPKGEYTRHLRHEEVSKAVIQLWNANKIAARELWTFAYEDSGKAYFPRPMKTVDLHFQLPEKILEKKYQLITETYGFEESSWEAKTCPKTEAFFRYQKLAPFEITS